MSGTDLLNFSDLMSESNPQQGVTINLTTKTCDTSPEDPFETVEKQVRLI